MSTEKDFAQTYSKLSTVISHPHDHGKLASDCDDDQSGSKGIVPADLSQF